MKTLLTALLVAGLASGPARATSPESSVSISRAAAKLLKKRGLIFTGFKLCDVDGQESGLDFAFGGATTALKVKTDPKDSRALLVGMLDKAGHIDSAIRVSLRGSQPVISPVNEPEPFYDKFFLD